MTDVAETGADALDPEIAINQGEPGDVVAEARENLERAQAKLEKERAALAAVEETVAAAEAALREVEGA